MCFLDAEDDVDLGGGGCVVVCTVWGCGRWCGPQCGVGVGWGGWELGEWELVADHRACVTYYFRIPKLKQDPGVPVSVAHYTFHLRTGYPSEIHLAYVQYVAH